MQLSELRKTCEEQINDDEWVGKPKILLIIPGSFSERKRLFGRKGPTGFCVCQTQKGNVCYFEAQKVLDYLDKHNLGS